MKKGKGQVSKSDPVTAAERKQLPNQTVFSVEYPGYVNNTNEAIETLGGYRRIQKAASGVRGSKGELTNLDIRFRYNDPTSHPIEGTNSSTNNLLIKVTKKKRRPKALSTGDSEGEATQVTAKVVGVIARTARFHKLADFQYVVGKNDPLVQFSRVLRGMDIEETKKMCQEGFLEANLDASTSYMPAPFLDRTCWPSQFPLTKGINDVHHVPASREKLRFYGASIKFSNETVPTQAPQRALEIAKKLPPALLKRAQEMFKDVPVISRNAVEILIPHSERGGWRVSSAMATVAYIIETGPWRSCWIKLGYDPRKHKEAYKYQVIDIRDTFTKSMRFEQSRVHRTGTQPVKVEGKTANEHKNVEENQQCQGYIYDKEALSQGASGIFQLMHVQIPQLNELIDYPNGIRQQLSKQDGWLYRSLWDAIRLTNRALRKQYNSQDGTSTAGAPLEYVVDYQELERNISNERRAESRLLEKEEKGDIAETEHLSQSFDEQIEEGMGILLRGMDIHGDLEESFEPFNDNEE